MSNEREIVCVCVGGWKLKVSPFKDIAIVFVIYYTVRNYG